MKKQLKYLTILERSAICQSQQCYTCRFGYKQEDSDSPNHTFCKLDIDYIREHPEEWIEWGEEEKTETASEEEHNTGTIIPKGFIEVIEKGRKHLVNVSWITKVHPTEICLFHHSFPICFEESYEEIKAKIAEALR